MPHGNCSNVKSDHGFRSVNGKLLRRSTSCTFYRYRTDKDLQAALGHHLVVLRANAVIPEPASTTTPVDEELCRFDVHMDQVRGLAATTRRFDRYIIRCFLRCFLLRQFGDDPRSPRTAVSSGHKTGYRHFPPPGLSSKSPHLALHDGQQGFDWSSGRRDSYT